MSDNYINSAGEIKNVSSIVIGDGSNPSAALDVNSTTQGLGLPEMSTSEKEAISSPKNGLMVMDTDDGLVNFYSTSLSAWNPVSITSHAEYYVSSSAETTISAINTPVKAAGTTTSGEIKNFTHSNNRATYTGKDTYVFQILASITLDVVSNQQNISFYVAKNGVVESKSRQQRRSANAADVGSISINTMLSLEENDYIEIWVENNTSTSNLTFNFMNVSVIGV